MILFDLDGTLVDSASEIESCMMHAWSLVRETPFPRERLLIGPPLPALIDALMPAADPKDREIFATAFKAKYDASDYTLTQPFPGIAAMLDDLRARQIPLGVATNKRRKPSVRILERWLPNRFDIVMCGDDGLPSKTAMIQKIAATKALVGDTAADIEAAKAAGVRSIAVSWGYESMEALKKAAPDALATTVAELANALSTA